MPKQPNFKYDCGDEVKDKITGFVGIVNCRTQWLNNCSTYGVKSRKLKDGAMLSQESFDEPQLELVKRKALEPKQNTGGPCDSVKRTNR